jgi:SRSO17 transposase
LREPAHCEQRPCWFLGTSARAASACGGIALVRAHGMSWREEAGAVLLADCVVRPGSLRPCLERLRDFAARYEHHFARLEHRVLGLEYLRGLLSPLERKSIEPIATAAGRPRRALQRFVGAGKWDDDAIMAELRGHVAEELGHAEGVLVIDTSEFAKKGTHSVGVKRQWCGRLGKEENCQSGVFLGYASPRGYTLVARELYLPEEWATDRARRSECHVPDEVEFRKSWQIADEWLLAHAHELPHRWVLGDEALGKSGDFRASLHGRSERYLLQVQATRTVRIVGKRQPKKRPPFQAVGSWAAALPPSAWRRLRVRAGEKGWIDQYAVRRTVQTKSHGRIYPHQETLLVTRTPGPRPEYRYWLTNDLEAPLEQMVEAAAQRHWIEQAFERAKGEVGLADYEVRSWVGWHHHMTLALLALFFLVLEQRRVG